VSRYLRVDKVRAEEAVRAAGQSTTHDVAADSELAGGRLDRHPLSFDKIDWEDG